METNILNQIQHLCSAVSYLNQTIGGEEYTCDESFLNTWIDTKSAHGWNWVVLNLGQDFNSDGEHTFAIKGTYEIEDEDGIKGNGNGTAVTMQRSLIVIPTQLDVGAGE
jgi:hypothetical protein